MLAHPFLGRQSDVFSAQEVENLAFLTFLSDFYWV
jgi:hypothetical protein